MPRRRRALPSRRPAPRAAPRGRGRRGDPGHRPGTRADAIASVDDATIRFEPLGAAADHRTLLAGVRPRPRPSTRAGSLAATRPGARRGSRLPLVIVLAALALVVLVGGVGAYVLLPSASIVVTPRVEDLALPALTVAADPTATEPDAATRVVPAELVSNDVVISDSFPATGKRVEEDGGRGRRPVLQPRLPAQQHDRRRAASSARTRASGSGPRRRSRFRAPTSWV